MYSLDGLADFALTLFAYHVLNRQQMIDVKKVTGATEITPETCEAGVVLFAIECRGLEPVEWMPKADFTATTTGENPAVFRDIEIEDGYFGEYDTENDLPVSVSELSHEFVVC